MNLIHNGLTEQIRAKIANRLNILLANEFVLYIKTLNYHWNVQGPVFGPLHKLFNDQYKELLDIIDELAERIRALDMHAFGTMKEYIKNATIEEEKPNQYPVPTQMIAHLVHDHDAIITQLRKDIEFTDKHDDTGTNNFLSELIEKHEKIAWMLRAHLQE